MDIIHVDIHVGNIAIHNNRIALIDVGESNIIATSEQTERRVSNITLSWVSPRIDMQNKYLGEIDTHIHVLYVNLFEIVVLLRPVE